jgi:hypothetical protein
MLQVGRASSGGGSELARVARCTVSMDMALTNQALVTWQASESWARPYRLLSGETVGPVLRDAVPGGNGKPTRGRQGTFFKKRV